MSNGRRAGAGNTYRTGYLRSRAWYTRRRRWFQDEAARHGTVRCAVTGQAGSTRTLQLHHVDYSGVNRGPAGWIAGEAHDDLVALRPDVHEALHRMLDTDQVLRRNLDRRLATRVAIRKLRDRIITTVHAWSAHQEGAAQ